MALINNTIPLFVTTSCGALMRPSGDVFISPSAQILNSSGLGEPLWSDVNSAQGTPPGQFIHINGGKAVPPTQIYFFAFEPVPTSTPAGMVDCKLCGINPNNGDLTEYHQFQYYRYGGRTPIFSYHEFDNHFEIDEGSQSSGNSFPLKRLFIDTGRLEVEQNSVGLYPSQAIVDYKNRLRWTGGLASENPYAGWDSQFTNLRVQTFEDTDVPFATELSFFGTSNTVNAFDYQDELVFSNGQFPLSDICKIVLWGEGASGITARLAFSELGPDGQSIQLDGYQEYQFNGQKGYNLTETITSPTAYYAQEVLFASGDSCQRFPFTIFKGSDDAGGDGIFRVPTDDEYGVPINAVLAVDRNSKDVYIAANYGNRWTSDDCKLTFFKYTDNGANREKLFDIPSSGMLQFGIDLLLMNTQGLVTNPYHNLYLNNQYIHSIAEFDLTDLPANFGQSTYRHVTDGYVSIKLFPQPDNRYTTTIKPTVISNNNTIWSLTDWKAVGIYCQSSYGSEDSDDLGVNLSNIYSAYNPPHNNSIYIGRTHSTVNQSNNTSAIWKDAKLRLEFITDGLDSSGIRIADVSFIASCSGDVIHGTGISTTGTLYCEGLGAIASGIDLYIKGGFSGIHNNLDLYVGGNLTANSGMTLYTIGGFPSSIMPLYVKGPIPTVFNTNIPLTVFGAGSSGINGVATLYLDSTNEDISEMPLFIKAPLEQPFASNLNLYVGGRYASLTNDISMFLMNEGITNEVSLYTRGNTATNPDPSDDDEGGIPIFGGMPLYIHRPNDVQTMTLYLHNTETREETTLYTMGVYGVSSGIPLVIPKSVDDSTSSVSLFTRGF